MTKALLVIDTQVAMIDEDPPPYRAKDVIGVIQGLISRSREAGAAVIYVQHEDTDYEPMRPGQPGFEIHPDIAPAVGDPVVYKRASDSFYATTLQDELAARGVTDLVICGLQTELCVDTTCRNALSRDYDVVLVADGHTTWNSKELKAQQIIDHVNATLPNIPHPSRQIMVKQASEVAFA